LDICGIDPGPVIKINEGGEIVIEEIDNMKTINSVNRTEAEVLIVAFGQVKQEEWIEKFLSSMPKVKVAIGVGGTFHFISGKIPRAPLFLRRIGLEWIYRLFKQPAKRLRRVWRATIIFLFLFLTKKINMTERRRVNIAALFHKSERPIGSISADSEGVLQDTMRAAKDNNQVLPVFANETGVVRGDSSYIVDRKDSGHEYPVTAVDPSKDEPAQFVLRAGVSEGLPPAVENASGLYHGPIRVMRRYDHDSGQITSVHEGSRLIKQHRPQAEEDVSSEK